MLRDAYQTFLSAPGKYLQDLLIERKQKNRAYSSRRLAKFLGISSGFISQLMSGKRNLSLEQKLVLAEKLGLTPSKRETRTNKNESVILNRIEHDRILKHPYHFSLLEIAGTKRNTLNIKTLSSRLKLSELEVTRAVERLCHFGYLEIKRNKSGTKILSRTKSVLIFDPKSSSDALREFHDASLECAQSELKATSPSRIQKRNFQTVMIATRPEKIEKAREMIQAFSLELFRYLKDDQASEVFQWSTQLFSAENKQEPSNQTGELNDPLSI